MALSPLTISVTSGVQGRSFKSAVSGFAAGNVVEVLPGGSWGFGYSNGFLTHNGLPADTNLAILRERNPVTGENLTTNLIITAASAYAVAQKASALDATYLTYRIAPVTQGDGSQIWNVFTEGQTGAVQNTPVNGALTLGTLTLSGSLQIGTAASGTIIGATAGSTITGNIPGITVNSGARTYSGTPTGSAATISNGLVETLAGATNTPNNSSITVAAAAVTLSALTLSPLTATTGAAYSGTISAATTGSTITATSSDGTTMTVSGTGTTRTLAGTFSGAGTPTITMTETLAGATNSPNNSTASVTVSAAITLAALSLSGSLQNGVATSGTITGATAGSTIACNIPGITVNSAARTYSGTPTAMATYANGLVEALAGATNTPNSSSFTVAAAAVPLAGSRVAAWYAEDLVTAGLGNLATVGTAGVSPWVDRINSIQALVGAGTTKLKTNAEGTFPSVWFNASYLTAGQNATLLAAINSKTYTIYAVVKNLLAAGVASIASTSGTSNFFFTADGINIGSSAATVPFLPAQGASLFSVGMRGSFTGGGTDGTWVSDNHTIINGCAAAGNASPLRAATAASDIFIGGQGGAAGKMEILELHIWPSNLTHAQDIQFHKYVCDKYGKTYPWAGQSYMPVLAGDSITNGTLCDSWAVATPKVIADTLGLGFGQWINASTPAISAASLLLKDATTLPGLPQQFSIPTKIHEFEFVNNLTHSRNSAQSVTDQQNICAMYKSQGFTKVILGSTLDYGNRTNSGANSKAAFVAGLIALPAGTYDYFNPLHSDTTIGVDGTAPNTGSNTYFADNIAHPTGHANFPTVQSGAPYLAAMISAAFAAA